MATIKAGGRPQNAWTPSRKRKLVRLYTLTYLKVDEVTKALADVGFNPSRRDIQSKLKSLFSDDYTKDHRKYRPSGPLSMKTRLRCIRQQRRLRISASGGACGDCQHPVKTDSSLPMNLHTESNESMFLGEYQEYSFPSSVHNFTTSPALGFVAESSEPNIPSQLLIDEPSISPCHALDDLQAHPDYSGSLSRAPYYQHGPPAVPLYEGVASKVANHGSKVASFQCALSNLGHKLGNKYSPSILEHIQSVLRSTPGSSWKSNLLSLGNTHMFPEPSSRPVHEASPGSNAAILETLPMSLSDSKVEFVPKSPINDTVKLNTVEQTIWDNLIDETKLDLGSHKFFAPGLPSSLTKKCCKSATFLSYKTSCITCGRTQAHWTANHASLGEILAIPKQYLNEPDFFGNTAFHYLMFNPYLETTRLKYHALIDMVKRGVDISAINTFGQTFLHLLHEIHDISTSQFSTFISALRLLSILDFPFAHRDRYGRTILHTVLQNNSSGFQSLADFENFITICGVNVHAYDIFGRTVLDLLKGRLLEIGMDQAQIDTRVSEKYANRQQESAIPIFSIQESSSPMVWVNKIKQGKLVAWVDVDGNTPLHALLKIWPRNRGEVQLSNLVSELLVEGADIHMRDRDGNTPLAVAAISGRRPSVQILLDAGSSIHCRNFRGRGILAQCYNARQKAKREENQELYAMILSCSTLLVDADAKERPNGMDEWLLSTISRVTTA